MGGAKEEGEENKDAAAAGAVPVANGNAAAPAQETADEEDEFQDAPEEPIESRPLDATVTKGVEGLSLQENEKMTTTTTTTETPANGKTVDATS